MSNQCSPSGPPNAKIMIIGESAGDSDIRSNIPFSGGTGQVLNSILQAVGIDKRNCYCTHLVKTKIYSFKVMYEDKSKRIPSKLLSSCRQELIEEIHRVKPNIVIGLGTEVLKALTGKTSLDKWRGSCVRITNGHKFIATYDPQYILKMYKHRPIMEQDLSKARKESEFPGYTYQPPEFEVCPSFETVMVRLEWIKKYKPRISLDVESSGRVIRCLGIGWSRHQSTCIEAICIPFACRKGFQNTAKVLMLPSSDQDFTGSSYWTLEEEHQILAMLEEIFLDRTIPKVLQNYPFDAELLWKEFGLQIIGLYMDTMVAQHCCYSELPKSLDFLTSIYTEIPYYADYNASNDEQTFVYNCFDCVATVRSSYRLDEELGGFGLTEFYHDHAQPEMEALTRMQNRGIPVSESARSEMRIELQGKCNDTQRLIAEQLGTSFNPRSHVQMKTLLYEKLKLPKQYDRKTKKLSSDAKTIEKLVKSFPQHKELLNGIIEYKVNERIINRFLTEKLRNNRQYTSFNATGTVNGRLSSSTNIWGEGDNLQNINRGSLRRIYACDENSWWIKVDLSQAEARGVAWLGKIRVLIDKFVQDPSFDIHTWNAAENIYHVPADTVTKEQRNISKPGVHGGNYGLREVTAAAIYKCSVAEAKLAIESYKNAVEIEDRYWKPIQLELLSKRILKSPMGRHRIFFDRLNDDTYRSAYSTNPQSIVADIIGRAIYVLDTILHLHGVELVLTVHDEINFICPKEKMETVMPIILEVMQYPVDFLDYNGIPEPMIIPADAGYGPNWYDQTPWEPKSAS